MNTSKRILSALFVTLAVTFASCVAKAETRTIDMMVAEFRAHSSYEEYPFGMLVDDNWSEEIDNSWALILRHVLNYYGTGTGFVDSLDYTTRDNGDFILGFVSGDGDGLLDGTMDSWSLVLNNNYVFDLDGSYFSIDSQQISLRTLLESAAPNVNTFYPNYTGYYSADENLGWKFYSGAHPTFTISYAPVPEVESYLLLLAGLGLIACKMRGYRRA